VPDGSAVPRKKKQKRTGASFNRGGSKQDVGTPPAFIEAVVRRFGPLAWDLAALAANSVCGGCYFGPDQPREGWRDSLAPSSDWLALPGNLWLNPPFSKIDPWAEKCASVRWRPAWTLLLVPNATGSNWYEQHVKNQCLELYLNGRITFVGETQPYPKDLALFCFGFGAVGKDTWRWDTSRKWRVKA
jgi:DNA (cytosine-5)-methyltransferase 1